PVRWKHEKIENRILPARSVRRSARSTRWNARSARVFGWGLEAVVGENCSIQFLHSSSRGAQQSGRGAPGWVQTTLLCEPPAAKDPASPLPKEHHHFLALWCSLGAWMAPV